MTAGHGLIDPLGGTDARRAIALLRQSGRYLAPSGTVDYWYALTILVRNWIGVHIVIGSTIFAVALIGVWLRALGLWYKLPSLHLAGLDFDIVAVLPVLLLAVSASFAWAYWLTRRDVGSVTGRGQIALLASVALIVFCFWLPTQGPSVISLGVGGIGSIALLVWLVGWFRTFPAASRSWSFKATPSARLEQAWDTQRVWMTRAESNLIRAACITGGFVVVDTLAFWIANVTNLWTLSASPLVTVALVPLARALLTRVDAVRSILQGRFRRAAVKILIVGAAAILVAVTIGFWEVLAYRTAWPDAATRPLFVATAISAILVLGVRWTTSFLNLSSLATFYAGRLRRAYLGAGNRARLDGAVGVEKGEAGDDLHLIEYYDQAPPGAPLHLIGVTLNQTRGHDSNIVQRDRRGRNIALGPAGFGISHAQGIGRTLIEYGNDRAEERLPLSTWIGISGASFSTGIGPRTGFGLTTLAGLANVRLGYWWRAGSSKTRDRSVQGYLFNELRGRFAGTDERRWYLSDGGHFDNTAIYELIRRRLPFILASDNGQDEAYAYEDIANLVRKARIDFGAEITFLDAETLDANLGAESHVRRAFGTLAQIGGSAPPAPGAVAALATIAYDGEGFGTLVLMKPRLTGDGPADLMRYRAENEAFPQQPTLDQFFDEAQWESYYALGRHITRLVMAPTDGKWCPGSLKPLGPWPV
jgi:hypothetical protein